MNSSHVEVVYAMYQCAKFYNDPKHTHKLSTNRYSDFYQGLLFKVDKTKSVDVYADGSFVGD